MDIEIVSPKMTVPTPLRHLVHTRLRYALAPFARGIAAVTVTFERLSGAGGGHGLRCRLRVLPRRGDELVVTGTDDSPRAALSVAAARAERCLRERTRRRWLTWRRAYRGGWGTGAPAGPVSADPGAAGATG